MFSKMVDLRRTEEDRKREMESMYPAAPAADVPDYPYGLCISLTDVELEKLDLDADCQAGDLIDLRAIGKVTSVSHREEGGKTKCRIEIQLTQLAVENEDTEEVPAARIDRARRYAR